MEKYVLFSPIGTTDPISSNHDGAMLHICRKYRPFKVYMYLSQEMMKYRDLDDRYRYSLEQLSKSMGISFEMEEIERPELKDVQRFDIFYNDFESLLKKIQADYPESKILLNISSGTPAMKSALQLMAALDERFLAIQVDSPNRSSNPKKEDIQKYALEEEWACNEDNIENYKNRAIESPHLNLLARLKRETIIKHIDVYDYQAALSIAKEIPEYLSTEALRLLEAAVARLQLNKSAMDKLFSGTEYEQQIIPLRSGDERSVMEFLLWLQIKLERGDLADFIRGITPVVADLLERALLKKYRINIRDYAEKRKYKDREVEMCRLTRDEFSKTDTGKKLLGILDEYYSYKYKNKDRIYQDAAMTSSQLTAILEAYAGEDLDFRNRIRDIREVEEKIRNLAAHEIVSITQEWIQKKCGFSSKEIMDKIRKLALDAQMKINGDSWKSYQRMNDLIKGNLYFKQ